MKLKNDYHIPSTSYLSKIGKYMPAGMLFKSVTLLDNTWTYVMTLFGDVDSGKKKYVYALCVCLFNDLYFLFLSITACLFVFALDYSFLNSFLYYL